VTTIREVYSRLAEAEKRGADVREAAMRLNDALELVREAEENVENRSALLSAARSIVEDVNSSIPVLIAEGGERLFWRNVVLAASIVSIAASCVAVYRLGPRVFWETWLRLRSRWIVEVVGRRDRGVVEG